MTVSRYIESQKLRSTVSTGFERFLVILLSVTLLLGPAIPQEANSATIRVEICHEAAAHMAKMEMRMDGSIPVSECANCDLCALPILDSYDPLLFAHKTSLQLKLATTGWAKTLVDHPAFPAQFWSVSRGPPLTYVENNMLPNRVWLNERSAALIASHWRAP